MKALAPWRGGTTLGTEIKDGGVYVFTAGRRRWLEDHQAPSPAPPKRKRRPSDPFIDVHDPLRLSDD